MRGDKPVYWRMARYGLRYAGRAPADLTNELARELEARKFDSLFVWEHTHIPVGRRTSFPGGGELPKRYSHTHDPSLR